jgi:EpsI family protein
MMRAAARVAVSGALLLGALWLLQLRSSGEAVPLRRSLDAVPMSVGAWQGRESTQIEAKALSILKLDDYVMRRYSEATGRSVGLYIAYWATQRRGALIHSPKNCLPGSGWEPVEATTIAIPLPAPYAPIVVNRYVVQKDREMQLALYWYQSRGRVMAGEVAAKIEMVRGAITQNRTDAALVRVLTPVQGGIPEATDRLVRYVQALYPLLGEFLPE